ncbi:MAG: glycosyltransferase family 4 protein [Bdellovibrionales bacterium]
MGLFFWKSDQPLPEVLNICIVARSFPILGRAADHGFLWPIAKGLAKRGHKVTVISWKNPQGKDLIEKDGVSAHFIGNRELSDIKIDEKLNSKFKELHTSNPFHIAHCIDRHGLLIARRRKAYQVAVAFDSDATQMSQLFAIMGMAQDSLSELIKTGLAMLYKFTSTYFGGDRALLNSADGVFVTSPQQRVVLERYYLYPELKTYVVPYGIEISELSEREKSDELRKELKIPGNAHVVMTFTDMTELEDVVNLLKAFEKVAIKKPSARLIIVGNGPLKRQIQYEMLQLALGSKVVFTGAIRNVDIPDYLSLADVFV